MGLSALGQGELSAVTSVHADLSSVFGTKQVVSKFRLAVVRVNLQVVRSRSGQKVQETQCSVPETEVSGMKVQPQTEQDSSETPGFVSGVSGAPCPSASTG